MKRLAIASLVVFGLAACQKREQASSTDSTARNLTLAPAESTTQMRDVPERQPTTQPTTPRNRTPANRARGTNPPPARPSHC